MAAPWLVVVSGRMGTGKTTLARGVAQQIPATYLRVDAAEVALSRLGIDIGVAGYAVTHEMAASNLLLGHDVVVDAVNPVPEARAGWHATARRTGARLLCVETSLPDTVEHRRRVEAREPDLDGHRLPTWCDVEHDGWVPWDEARDGVRLLVDTTDADLARRCVLDALRRRGADR